MSFSFYGRCVAKECQVAALELLVELAEDCSENLFFIVSQLISMHHIGDPATLKEWEVQKYEKLTNNNNIIIFFPFSVITILINYVAQDCLDFFLYIVSFTTPFMQYLVKSVHYQGWK